MLKSGTWPTVYIMLFLTKESWKWWKVPFINPFAVIMIPAKNAIFLTVLAPVIETVFPSSASLIFGRGIPGFYHVKPMSVSRTSTKNIASLQFASNAYKFIIIGPSFARSSMYVNELAFLLFNNIGFILSVWQRNFIKKVMKITIYIQLYLFTYLPSWNNVWSRSCKMHPCRFRLCWSLLFCQFYDV